MTTTQQQINRFITELARVLYRQPGMGVGCEWHEDQLTIVLQDQDPGVLIGGKGSMKFAIQNVVADQMGNHPELQRIHIEALGDTRRLEHVTDARPDKGKIEAFFSALRGMLGGDGSIEQSETMVHCRMTLESDATKRLAKHLHRMVRVAGRSNGFPVTLYIDPE